MGGTNPNKKESLQSREKHLGVRWREKRNEYLHFYGACYQQSSMHNENPWCSKKMS